MNGNSTFFSNGNSFSDDWRSLPWLFRQATAQASVQR